MTKFSSADVSRIAARLRRARKHGRGFHFLIGAGCSISAGIPTATDLVKQIYAEYPSEYAALSDDNRYSYGASMALLSINERRDLVRPYLENAQINWGTIALAQLIREGFVERVLSVNFDLLLENACGLLGVQPAVYDLGAASAGDPSLIVSPSIIHLHGQSYGFVLLNNDEETHKHREKLRPILIDTLRSAPLVIIGYGGSADGVSQTLLDEFEGREPLYWVGHSDEIASHLQGFLKKNLFEYFGGADFDRFMIELAQSLGCWPPSLFSDPLGHLLQRLSPVSAYPVSHSDNAIDLLRDLRRKLETWQQTLHEGVESEGSFQELHMKGDFEGVVKRFESDRASISDEEREIVYWSLIEWGDLLLDRAKLASGKDASQLFAMAAEKYDAAFSIKKGGHEALNNWGLLLHAQAKRASGQEALQLFAAAAEKYTAALSIKPDKQEALNNWGTLLAEQAERASGEEASRLSAAAAEKFAAALSIEPSKPHVLNNLGALLLQQAKRTSGEEASRLFAAAAEKLEAAAAIDISKTYNLACLGALRGDEVRCRYNLENAEKHGTLPNLEHLASDTDLNNMRGKAWFKELLDRQRMKTSS